jgi:hypothetical protein
LADRKDKRSNRRHGRRQCPTRRSDHDVLPRRRRPFSARRPFIGRV